MDMKRGDEANSSPPFLASYPPWSDKVTYNPPFGGGLLEEAMFSKHPYGYEEGTRQTQAQAPRSKLHTKRGRGKLKPPVLSFIPTLVRQSYLKPPFQLE
jgi:hypothetical protein